MSTKKNKIMNVNNNIVEHTDGSKTKVRNTSGNTSDIQQKGMAGDRTTDAPSPLRYDGYPHKPHEEQPSKYSDVENTRMNAIAGSAQSQVFSYTIDGVFKEILSRSEVILSNSKTTKNEVSDILENLKQEIKKGDKANLPKTKKWLRALRNKSLEVFNIVIDKITNPVFEVAKSVSLTAQSIKEEK